LIQQSHRNKIQAEIEHLQAEIKQMKKNKADQAENIRQQKALKIAELQDQIENKRIENQNQYEALEQ
jgi:ribosome-interacting GTPase 1